MSEAMGGASCEVTVVLETAVSLLTQRYHVVLGDRSQSAPGVQGVHSIMGIPPMSSHHGILLHVVFSTKYRKPCLADEWRDDLFGFVGVTVKAHKAALIKSGGIEGHVHLLLRIHPQFAISNTIQLVKANSSRWLNEQRLVIGKFEWQREYGAFSVSPSMVAVVADYIANQRKHHHSRSFEDEYLDLLRKHQIEFDPRYVFQTEFVG